MEARPEKIHFTIAEYHMMGKLGILKEKGTELIYGEIVKKMSPIGKEHSSSVNRLNAFFNSLIGDKTIIAVQNPIEIINHSEPEPDITILKFKADYYASAHPQVEEVLLLIEVAGSSLAYDREVKLPLYAQAGISEYWIVNLIDRQIEAHRLPYENLYKIREIAQGKDSLKIPGFELSVSADQIFI